MAKPDGRIEKGQRLSTAISARRWNDLCDAADVVQGRRPGVQAGPIQGPPLTFLTVLVKNDTENDIPIGGWLNLRYRKVIGDYSPVVNEIGINNPGRTEAVEPIFIGSSRVGSEGHAGIGDHDIVVAIEPIKAGEYGRCAFEGIVPARLAVTGPYGDPLTEKANVTGGNFFPGPADGEVPWHAIPPLFPRETSHLIPVSNSQTGARPIRILWIEDQVNTGATGPSYRNALVRIHGSDTNFIRHVLCTTDMKHPDQIRINKSFTESSLCTGIACDSTGIPIVKYTYSATGVSTGPEVIRFASFLQPPKQLRPSGVYVTVARARQQTNKAEGGLVSPFYWAIATDHPTSRGVRYEHGTQSNWLAGTSRTVTFFDLSNNVQNSFSGTVAQRLGTISESFDGIAVAAANGSWNLVSCPITVLSEYKSLNTRLQALENANLINRVTALENA